MVYSKQTWVNGVSGGTPINATRLNHVEDGVLEVSTEVFTGRLAAGKVPLLDAGTPPTDQQGLNYSTTLGMWIPANISGSAQLALATNKTGTTTTLPNGVVTLIAGTTINIASSGGRPVALKFSATFIQSVTGLGSFGLALYDTSGTPTFLEIAQIPLPNTATANLNRCTLTHSFDVPAFSTPKQYILYGLLRRETGSSADGFVMNNATAPTYLKAVAE